MAEPEKTETPKAKTREEQLREQKEAQEQIDALLKQTRPKNIGQGVTSGIGNIVGGALGAVGIIVVAPVMGATVGAQGAGVVGGTVGLVGGAVAGVVGGAAVLVGGTVQGVAQIVRGVAAQPDAMIQPSKGKWWNEHEGKWIETNLEDESKALSGVPSDDKDILGAAQDEIAEETSGDGSGAANVKDTYYYDCLEVAPDAEQGKIKRQYYVLARKYHPDRVGPDDKESADKFKEIAEAYQVLSDPKLRKAYDKDGREALSGDKTTTNEDGPSIDPALLFAFLFGSDKFNDYVGRLAMASSALTGDSPKISAIDARRLQQRRCARLAIKLANKLEDWTKEEYELCKVQWQTEADELSKASYGSQMVHLIGQIYAVAAVQFLGALDSGIGTPSISQWASSQHAKMKKGRAKTKNQVDTIKAAMDTMQMQQKATAELAKAQTEEEKKAAEAKLAKEMHAGMLNVFWTMTVVDITSTLHEAVQMVLFDQAVSLDVRKRRAHGIKKLGEIFSECPAPEGKDGEGPEPDAQRLYEEAAFAAMLETIQRKDQASANASVQGH